MPRITSLFGTVLVLMGVGSYFATGSTSFTALIPAAFGGILLLTAWLAHRFPATRMHAMHVATLVSVLGAMGGFSMSLRKLPRLLRGEFVARPIAVWLQFGMAVLLLVFLGFSIKSFIDARRKRA